jgi:hypothetical protein
MFRRSAKPNDWPNKRKRVAGRMDSHQGRWRFQHRLPMRKELGMCWRPGQNRSSRSGRSRQPMGQQQEDAEHWDRRHQRPHPCCWHW